MFNGSIPIGEPVSFVNGKANIDLTNVQINKTGMKLTFSDHGKKFIAVVEENSKIKEAAGIYLAGKYKPVVTSSTVSFPFALQSNIKSCEVTNGSLEVKINRPDGWAAVIPNYTISLSGGITESFDEAHTTKTYNSSNKLTLVNGNIVATPTITVTINNATMNFENGPSVDAKVTINTVNAVVKLKDGYKTEIIKEEDVSDSMKQYIERIYWNPSGFNILATAPGVSFISGAKG